jgi:flavin-dependent dehydrogenase
MTEALVAYMGSNSTDSGKHLLACDVMIVGAGPAGISTWLHLHKWAPQLSANSVIIDKAVFPRDKVCAGGVGAWSFDVLDYLDIRLDLPSITISEIEFKFKDETRRIYNPHRFKSVQRRAFDHAMVKTAINRGLELRENEKLIDLFRDGNHLIVKTSLNHYRVKVIIGADGALSRVRRAMMPGGKMNFAPTLQTFVPADSNIAAEFKDKRILLDFTPVKEGLQGYIWRVPCLWNDKLSIACGIVDFRFFKNRARANMKRIFSRDLKAGNQYQSPKCWQSHPIHWLSETDAISQPNVLLVGDAAGIEPAFGGGIHMSLSYGEIAAQAMLDAFQENDFTFSDYMKRLQAHIAGKVLKEYTRVAAEIYGGNLDLSEIVRAFSFKKIFSRDLLSLLLNQK